MTTGPTADEIAIFNEIGLLAEKIWERSKGYEGTIADPKLVAMILFRRLRAHHRAYAILWQNGCYGEGEIIVRSSVETTICIAANLRMGGEFPHLMRRDAAATLQGQIKVHREAESEAMVKSTEAALRYLQAGFAEGEKAAFLNWKGLAEAGQVPQLYGFHKMLSGLSSHVTGISLIRGIGDHKLEEMQNVLFAVTKRNYFNMIACATLNGSLIQTSIIDDAELALEALALTERMNELSMSWPENAKG
ncbi:hypothetical protein [Sphingobium sp. Z007]|uniref:hypothetical protein n=1 Tax=Sphingobium sp. Z007 TaxID=627495 RepID=UPI000B49EA50|nr:hypothetical protein [Sphingobium sp. Z007]